MTTRAWTRRLALCATLAAPLLLALFDALPEESEPDPLAPMPLASLETSQVPRGLRNFADRASLRAAPGAQPPRILYPPDGAQLDTRREGGTHGVVQLEANAGTPPYRWSVNGMPVPEGLAGGHAHWQPDGPGFARLTVIDAAGKRASVSVRIQ